MTKNFKRIPSISVDNFCEVFISRYTFLLCIFIYNFHLCRVLLQMMVTAYLTEKTGILWNLSLFIKRIYPYLNFLFVFHLCRLVEMKVFFRPFLLFDVKNPIFNRLSRHLLARLPWLDFDIFILGARDKNRVLVLIWWVYYICYKRVKFGEKKNLFH